MCIALSIYVLYHYGFMETANEISRVVLREEFMGPEMIIGEKFP